MVIKKRTTPRIQRFWITIHFFTLIAILFLAIPSMAQQSRAEVLALQKAAKAKELHPYVPNKAERIVSRIEGYGFFGAQPSGFLPILGSAYRTGSFAGGAGYGLPFGETGMFSALGLWSIRNYKRLEANLHLPELASRTIKIDVNGYWLDAPKMPFYGIGPDSDKDDKTDYGYKPYFGGVTATINPAKYFYFGGGADYGLAKTEEGDSGSVPSIEQIFPPSTVPGLFLDLTYLRARGFVMIDYRHDGPGFNQIGGMYRAEYLDYREQDSLPFDFQALDLEAIQIFPIMRAHCLIRLRARSMLTYTSDGNQVPFFLLPDLGGGRELRGFPDFRFMDNNKIVMSVEYVWTPSKFLQMYLFYEGGKVTPTRGEIDFSDLENSYGIGGRFHGPANRVALRIEIAKSDEFTRFNFSFGPAW